MLSTLPRRDCPRATVAQRGVGAGNDHQDRKGSRWRRICWDGWEKKTTCTSICSCNKPSTTVKSTNPKPRPSGLAFTEDVLFVLVSIFLIHRYMYMCMGTHQYNVCGFSYCFNFYCICFTILCVCFRNQNYTSCLPSAKPWQVMWFDQAFKQRLFSVYLFISNIKKYIWFGVNVFKQTQVIARKRTFYF